MTWLKRTLYSWIEKNFLGGCSNYNSLAVRKRCRSKEQARQMFEKHHIPHARGAVFYGPLTPILFVRRHGFPVVVKPNVGGFSRGSHFPITSWGQLLYSIIAVKIWWPGSVIETYLQGANYRVVLVKEGIMSVIRRYPPSVVGDGISSISDLIDRENKIRRHMKLTPVIHPIQKSRAVGRFLKKKGLTFSSVPGKGEQIVLFHRISLAPGGVVETINLDKVHPENRRLLTKILPLFKANILGVDVIFEKGIEYPHTQQRLIFLEVNSRPYLKMHDYPRFGDKPKLTRFYDRLNTLVIEQKDVF